jgi:hypothetical protein
MVSVKAVDVAEALVEIGEELNDDSVITASVGDVYGVDSDVVALTAGTSVESGTMEEVMDVALMMSVSMDSVEDGDKVGVGAINSVAGMSVVLGNAVELTNVALATSVLLSLSDVGEAAGLEII